MEEAKYKVVCNFNILTDAYNSEDDAWGAYYAIPEDKLPPPPARSDVHIEQVENFYFLVPVFDWRGEYQKGYRVTPFEGTESEAANKIDEYRGRGRALYVRNLEEANDDIISIERSFEDACMCQ